MRKGPKSSRGADYFGRVPKSSPFRGVTLFRPTGKWRAQISSGGKTTSLGDHDTQEQAAHAFDKAIINKDGRSARTNFPLEYYEMEFEQIHAMPCQDLVALLRSQARKSGHFRSTYKGVSLLKETGKWHAHFAFGEEEAVHLGFFSSEEGAARAYDRAAIFKGLQNGYFAETNFDFSEYEEEVSFISTLSREELITEFGHEGDKWIAGCRGAAAAAVAERATKQSRIKDVKRPRKGSRPPSPLTPQLSAEDGSVSQNSKSMSAASAIRIRKRVGNRRSRTSPVRSPFD